MMDNLNKEIADLKNQRKKLMEEIAELNAYTSLIHESHESLASHLRSEEKADKIARNLFQVIHRESVVEIEFIVDKAKQLLELIQDKNYLPTKAAAEELLFHARELASSWGYEIDENLPKS